MAARMTLPRRQLLAGLETLLGPGDHADVADHLLLLWNDNQTAVYALVWFLAEYKRHPTFLPT